MPLPRGPRFTTNPAKAMAARSLNPLQKIFDILEMPLNVTAGFAKEIYDQSGRNPFEIARSSIERGTTFREVVDNKVLAEGLNLVADPLNLLFSAKIAGFLAKGYKGFRAGRAGVAIGKAWSKTDDWQRFRQVKESMGNAFVSSAFQLLKYHPDFSRTKRTQFNLLLGHMSRRVWGNTVEPLIKLVPNQTRRRHILHIYEQLSPEYILATAHLPLDDLRKIAASGSKNADEAMATLKELHVSGTLPETAEGWVKYLEQSETLEDFIKNSPDELPAFRMNGKRTTTGTLHDGPNGPYWRSPKLDESGNPIFVSLRRATPHDMKSGIYKFEDGVPVDMATGDEIQDWMMANRGRLKGDAPPGTGGTFLDDGDRTALGTYDLRALKRGQKIETAEDLKDLSKFESIEDALDTYNLQEGYAGMVSPMGRYTSGVRRASERLDAAQIKAWTKKEKAEVWNRWQNNPNGEDLFKGDEFFMNDKTRQLVDNLDLNERHALDTMVELKRDIERQKVKMGMVTLDVMAGFYRKTGLAHIYHKAIDRPSMIQHLYSEIERTRRLQQKIESAGGIEAIQRAAGSGYKGAADVNLIDEIAEELNHIDDIGFGGEPAAYLKQLESGLDMAENTTLWMDNSRLQQLRARLVEQMVKKRHFEGTIAQVNRRAAEDAKLAKRAEDIRTARKAGKDLGEEGLLDPIDTRGFREKVGDIIEGKKKSIQDSLDKEKQIMDGTDGSKIFDDDFATIIGYEKAQVAMADLGQRYISVMYKHLDDSKLLIPANRAQSNTMIRNYLRDVMELDEPAIKRALQEGFVEVKLNAGSIVGDYMFPKGFAKEAKKIVEVVNNEKGQLDAFLASWAKYQGMWKAWTLAVFPAYHTRNAISNGFNNWLAGMDYVADPRLREEALLVSRTLHRAKMGIDLDDSAALFGHLTEKGLWDRAVFHGIVNSGEAAGELGNIMQRGEKFGLLKFAGVERELRKIGQTQGKRSFKRWALSAVDPRPDMNVFVQTGFDVGTYVEDHARLSHYVWSMRKGKTGLQARESVFKYLFDYRHGLTDFESKYFRNFAAPFYAWTRFNLPLQLEMLVKNPHKINTVGKVTKAWEDNFGGPSPDEMFQAQWMKRSWGIRLWYNKDRDTYEYFMMDNVIPLADLGKILSKKNLGDLIMNLASPGLKIPMEMLYNFNLFRKKPIKKFDGDKDIFFKGTPFQIDTDAYVGHVLRSVRLINTADKLLSKSGLSVKGKFSSYLLGKTYPYDPSSQRLWWTKALNLGIKELEQAKGQALRYGTIDEAVRAQITIDEMKDLRKGYGASDAQLKSFIKRRGWEKEKTERQIYTHPYYQKFKRESRKLRKP